MCENSCPPEPSGRRTTPSENGEELNLRIPLRLDSAIAVAAGCEPRWYPVVLAAYRAMAEPPFRLAQAAITTNPSGTLVLVSGPASDELDIASRAGCRRACSGRGRRWTRHSS